MVRMDMSIFRPLSAVSIFPYVLLTLARLLTKANKRVFQIILIRLPGYVPLQTENFSDSY
jgi:hypothetical protein